MVPEPAVIEDSSVESKINKLGRKIELSTQKKRKIRNSPGEIIVTCDS
jgi:hypothetical protein